MKERSECLEYNIIMVLWLSSGEIDWTSQIQIPNKTTYSIFDPFESPNESFDLRWNEFRKTLYVSKVLSVPSVAIFEEVVYETMNHI